MPVPGTSGPSWLIRAMCVFVETRGQALPWLLGSGMGKARGTLGMGISEEQMDIRAGKPEHAGFSSAQTCGLEALKLILCYLSHITGLMLKLIVWPPDAKNQLIRKDPDAGKD